MGAIDIGSDAIYKTNSYSTVGRTFLDLNNPANLSGVITTVQAYAEGGSLTGVRLGIFYLVSGTTYHCRSSVAVGDMAVNTVTTYSGLNLTVVAGDFIGIYCAGGLSTFRCNDGGVGIARYVGEAIDPGDEASYSITNTVNPPFGGTGSTSSVITYVVPAITDTKILPDTVISNDYLSSIISVSGSPNEYVPTSFALKASGDVTALAMSCSDLVKGGDSIPSSNINIRVVKCWYQRVVPFGEGSITPELNPELLLKNDGLIKTQVDDEVDNNYAYVSGGWVLISDRAEACNWTVCPFDGLRKIVAVADFPIQDEATLQTVDIPDGTNKQFWLTITIPNAQTKGTYTGTITLGALGTMTLNVEVLGITLQEPTQTYGLYYRGSYEQHDYPLGSISSETKTVAQLTAELTNMRDHGVNISMIPFATHEDWYAWEALHNQMTTRAALGMPITDVYLIGYYSAWWADVVTAARSWGATNVYLYVWDEPGPGDLANVITKCDAAHAAGGLAFAAIGAGLLTQSQLISLAPYLDLAILSDGSYYNYQFNVGQYVPDDAAIIAAYHDYGHKVFAYGDPQAGVYELPRTYRRWCGLRLWQNDFDGIMDYAYQDSSVNIWNDFEVTAAYKDHVMAYPTANGVIDTIEWEGWREAYNDMRYLATLQYCIANPAPGKNTALAIAYLDNLKSADLATLDFDTVRTDIVDYILDLTERVYNNAFSSIAAKVLNMGM